MALTKLRATLEGRWAEMVKARAEYRRVRLKYQRDMARVYSGQELVGGDDPSDAASTNLVKKSLGSLAGSPPPPPADAIHGVLSELLSRAEEELRGAFSLERGAEPMPLPEGRQRNQQEEQQWSFCGSDGSPVPHDAASALRMSTGSSVLIGASYLADDCLYHSTGATNGSSVGSVASTGHCTTAATAGGSTPRHLSLSMSPGMAACLIASPRAASTSPTPHNKQRTVVGQATAATGGVSRMGMKPPALRAKLPMGGTQGGRSKGVAGPKGHKGARKGPRKGHQVGTPQTSAAVEVQWRVVEGLMRGCEVLVVEPKDGKDAPRSNRASDPSMLLDTSRDTCDPSDRLGNPTALNLSSDYARLIFRRRGSHLSSFIRVADIVGLTDQGQWEFAASDAALQPAANLRASGAKSRGRKAVEPQGGDSTLIVVALPTLVVHLRDRNVTVAYHNPEEHVVWFEGLCLLLAHQDCLPRLKASLAPFQHPYLFANSRMAH